MKKAFLAVPVAVLAIVAGAILTDDSGARATWTWNQGVPRSPHTPTRAERGVAQSDRVDLASIRSLVTRRGLSILAARRGADACLSVSTGAIAESYECGQALRRPVFFRTVTTGRGSLIATYTLVGAARHDVRSVVLTLADGSSRPLTLGRFGEFSFSATTPDAFAISITVKTASGEETVEDISATAPS